MFKESHSEVMMCHLKPKCPEGDSHVHVWGQRIPHKGTRTWSLKWAQAGVTKDWMSGHCGWRRVLVKLTGVDRREADRSHIIYGEGHGKDFRFYFK